MPNHSQDIAQTFSALSDPTRCAVVAARSRGAATVSELSQPFDMALPSFTQHLSVLEAAGLIVSRREGRSRVCTLNPDALKAAEDWMATFRQAWEGRMDRLDDHLARIKRERTST